jgi:precorrin-6Y C5,15-methyltransferase (decarboxylating)
MPTIYIIGLSTEGEAGLRPELIDHIRQADFLAGGERHLRHFPNACGDRFIIRDNLRDLLVELCRRASSQNCVVLASGDPLFYGIGTYLARHIPAAELRIEPAVSSMQIAFARAALPWQDATLASIHGRELRPVLLPMLGRRLIGLFTQDGDSPAAVARFFLEHGLDDYEGFVAENLGMAEEGISRWANLGKLSRQSFTALNFLVLQRMTDSALLDEVDRLRGLAPGIPDEAFRRPEDKREIMTRQEIRSVVLGKLPPTCAGDTVWDMGAGLGTVSVEIAILRPDTEVVAVECDTERANYLRTNREQFGAYNIRVVEGIAPDALMNQSRRPRVVFIGGSGDRLADILDFVADRLDQGGRLLANFVTLEHLTAALQRLRVWHWPYEITEIQVARSGPLAGLTGLAPQRGVFVLSADEPR